MTITKTTIEHEFLFRWDEQGTPQGAHIAYREAILEDGVEIASKFLAPRPVQLSDADKLAEISAAINASVLAQHAEHTAAIATLTSEKATAISDRDAALAQVAELQAQLAALQPVVNGVPQFVKKWQLWAGLRKDDPTLTLYYAVRAYTASFTGAMKDLWDDSTGVERTSPALAGFKAGFGKTDADLDSMFTRYAALTQADVLALG